MFVILRLRSSSEFFSDIMMMVDDARVSCDHHHRATIPAGEGETCGAMRWLWLLRRIQTLSQGFIKSNLTYFNSKFFYVEPENISLRTEDGS